MLFIDNLGVTDPRVNLALEEYTLREKGAGEECLLFYVNAPAVIIGRNQNTIEEIDPEVISKRGIHVVRRMSGGGAVYHDLGNLNFSFMAPFVAERFSRFDHFTRPVIEVLRDLGVPAELSGRNDIVANGKKISGNAQFATGGRMFSHGTVLVSSNLDDVTAALRPKPGKVESKGVKSIRSRVANVCDFTREPITVDELRERILERLFGTRDRAKLPLVELTKADWDAVHELVAQKYGHWNWNYGANPACNIQRSRRFPVGELDIRLNVQENRINSVRIFGDFMGRLDVHELESRMVGLPYERSAIANTLGGVQLGAYFGEVSATEVLDLICG